MVVEAIKKIMYIVLALMLIVPVSMFTASGVQELDIYEVYGAVRDENENLIGANIVFEYGEETIEMTVQDNYSTDVSVLGVDYGDTVTVTAWAYNLYFEGGFVVEEGTYEKEFNITLIPGESILPDVPPVGDFDDPIQPPFDMWDIPDDFEFGPGFDRYLRPDSSYQPAPVERIKPEAAPLPNLIVELDIPPCVVVDAQTEIGITLLNDGNVQVDDNVTVELYIDGVMMDVQVVYMEGYTAETVFFWTPATAGVYELTVVVDPDDEISETRVDDNTASAVIKVYTPDILADDINIALDGFEADVDEMVDKNNAIKAQIANLRRDIDRALDAKQDFQKVQHINTAINRGLNIIDMIGRKRDRGEVTEEDASYLIGEMGEITKMTVCMQYTFMPTVEIRRLCTAEREVVEALMFGEIYLYDEDYWGDCKSDLLAALYKYGDAVFSVSKGRSYQEDIDMAYQFLLEALSSLHDDDDSSLYQLIVDAVMVFPPNMFVSSEDIDIEGDLWVDSRNRITFTVRNKEDVKIHSVDVDVYARLNGEREVLKSYTFRNIPVGGSVSRAFWWTPDTPGTYYIGVHIDPHDIMLESRKDDNVAESGVAVFELSTIYWDPGHVVTGIEEYVNETIILRNGDLIIPSGTELIFDNVTFRIESDRYDTPLRIRLDETGKFTIRDRTTIIARRRDAPYRFTAKGTLHIEDSWIQWTWGDRGGTHLTSGIHIASTGSATILNSTIHEGHTNNFFVDGGILTINDSVVSDAGVDSGLGDGIHARNGASLSVNGTDITGSFYGRGVTSLNGVLTMKGSTERESVISGNHVGVFAKGSVATVENCNIADSGNNGIIFQDTPEQIPKDKPEEWASGAYDTRLTSTAGRSFHPKVATGGDNAYMVWIDDSSGDPHVYFNRAPGGVHWSEPVRLSSDDEDAPVYADIAAEGNHVMVAYTFDSSFKTMLSDDGGRTWMLEEYYGGLHSPTIALGNGNRYISYTFFTGLVDPKLGPIQVAHTRLYWTNNGTFEESRVKNLDIGQSPTDIEVVDGTIYITSMWDGKIYFWRGENNGETWPVDRVEIAQYYGDYSSPYDDWIDLSIKDHNVAIVWADDHYGELKGLLSLQKGDIGSWSPLLTFSNSPHTPSMWPSADIDKNDNWHITWEEDNQLRYSRVDLYTLALEVTNVDMAPAFSTPRRPCITVGGDMIYYVWEGEVGAHSDIFIKTMSYQIKNNTVLNTKGQGQSVVLWNSSAAIINNIIQDGVIGVRVADRSNPVIYSNLIDGNFDVGIRTTSDSDPLIENNIINGTQTGIYMWAQIKTTEIYNNIIINNQNGMYIDGSSPTISNNIIRFSEQAGIWCKARPTTTRKHPYITNNRIVQNEFGIYSETSNPTIENNPEIAFNKVGIGIFHNSSAVINNNVINVLHYGIHVDDSEVEISNNNITGKGVVDFEGLSSKDFYSTSNRIYLKTTYIDTTYYPLETLMTEPQSSDKYLVQLVSAPKEEWIQELRSKGVRIHDYIPHNTYLVSDLSSEALELPYIRWLGEYKPEYKIDLSIDTRDEALLNYTIRMTDGPSFEDDFDNLSDIVNEVHSVEYVRDVYFVKVNANGYELSNASMLNSVVWIEKTYTIQTLDEVSAEIIGGNWTAGVPWGGPGTYANWLGYDGTGVNISVADSGIDTGTLNIMHPDLSGRIIYVNDYTKEYGTGEDLDGHGTHCAGVVAGDGTVGTTDDDGYLYGMGVAPDAHLLNQRIFGDDGQWAAPDLNVLTRDAVSNGADVGSNSWGAPTGGKYTIYDEIFDHLVRDADNTTEGDQEYILVFAAGNSGSNYYTTGSPANAKNVISVGASENYRPNVGDIMADDIDDIASFSSRGPTQDGRIKPDVVAPGTWIASTRTSLGGLGTHIDDHYTYMSGTSMATPHVAGGAALFVQYYRMHYGETPSPALTKAALINGADPITGISIPNMHEGWGRVNLTNTLNNEGKIYLNQQYALSTGEEMVIEFVVSDTTKPLKITMAYTDHPGTSSSERALINDLDLHLLNPKGTQYAGNQFKDGWSEPWVLEYDDINNVENIYIPPESLERGQYRLTVKGTSVVMDSVSTSPEVEQDFAMVISVGLGVTSEGFVHFDSPKYRSDDTALVSVYDSDLNTDPNTAESYWSDMFVVNSTSDPTPRALPIVETGEDTSIFQGQVPLTTDPSQFVYVNDGDTLTAVYEDADNGTGNPATVTATALIDDTPPEIYDVSYEILPYSRAMIYWRTDEDANATVIYGKDRPPQEIEIDQRFGTQHEVLLSDLTEGYYYFAVKSTDQAGNTAIDDNNGNYYKFRVFNYTPGGGIYIRNSDSYIHNNDINENYVGIIGTNESKLNIHENVIRDNMIEGVYARGRHFQEEIILNISDNHIHSNLFGIGVSERLVKASIIDNIIETNERAGIVTRGADVFAEKNIIQENKEYGVVALQTFFNELSYLNNTIERNVESGILFYQYSIKNGGITAQNDPEYKPGIHENTIRDNYNGIEFIHAQSSGTGPSITGNGDDPELSSFYIRVENNSISSNKFAGILDYNYDLLAKNNSVQNNNYYGIFFLGGAYSQSTGHVINNNISRNTYYGIFCAGHPQWGLGLLLARENSIQNNLVGAYVGLNGHGYIDDNIVTNNTYGIGIQYGRGNVTNNKIFNNSYGIGIDGSSNSYIEANVIFNNSEYGIYGLSASYPGYESVITDNSIFSNYLGGITLYDSPNIVISQNNISYNGKGVRHYGAINLIDSPDSIVEENEIYDNKNDAYGLYAETSDNIQVIGNKFALNTIGTFIHETSGSYIFDNEIKKCRSGIVIMHEEGDTYSVDNMIVGNQIEGEPLQEVRGVFLWGRKLANTTVMDNNISKMSSAVTLIHTYGNITNNEIHQSYKGMDMRGSKIRPECSQIDYNSIHNNTYGIYIDNYDTSISPKITYNTIRDNGDGIYIRYDEADNWNMYRKDEGRSGYTKDLTAYGELWWEHDIGVSTSSSPSVVNGSLYIGADDGKMYSFGIDGTMLWEYQTDGPVYSSPAVVDGRVYFGSDDNNIYCLDAQSGDLIWNYTLAGPTWSSPLIHNQTVYITYYYGNVIYALDIYTGELLWEKTVDGHVDSLSMLNSTLFFGDVNGKVYSMDPEDGTIIWTTQLSGAIYSCVIDGHVIEKDILIGTTAGYLYALKRETGELSWQTEVGPVDWASPAKGQSNWVYVASYDGYLSKLQAWNGEMVWRRKLGDEIYSSIVISPRLVGGIGFLGVDDKLVAVDLYNGYIIESYPMGSPVYTSPALTNDGLFVASYDGKLAARRSHVVVENNVITNNNNRGVYLDQVSGSSVVGNDLSNNNYGIQLISSNSNSISDTTASNNYYHGIYLSESRGNTISQNTFLENGHVISGTTEIQDVGESYEGVGIYLNQLSEDNIITNNTVGSNVLVGIYVQSSKSNTILHNRLYNHSMTTAGGYHGFGLLISDSGYNTISYNIAERNNHGICIDQSNHNTISYNSATMNDREGFYILHSSNNLISNNILEYTGLAIRLYNVGLLLVESNNNTIYKNAAFGNYGDGISIQSSSNNTIYDNVASYNCEAGIYVSKSNDIYVSHNTASYNMFIPMEWQNEPFGKDGTGIYVSNSEDIDINNNSVSDNEKNGFNILSSNNVLLNYNTISGNIYGINFTQSSYNEFRANVLKYNQHGINLEDSHYNEITDNRNGMGYTEEYQQYNEDVVLVGLNDIESDSPKLLTYMGDYLSAEIEREYSFINAVKLRLLDGMDVTEAINTLEKLDFVRYAEPDYRLQLHKTPNDPGYMDETLWGLNKINAPDAWNITTGSGEVVIGVIDSGIDYYHEDIKDNMWADEEGYHGYNGINNTYYPLDDYGHGTHVAGTIGAVGNNSIGVAGVNWNVSLMALKMIDKNRRGYLSGAIDCLEYVLMQQENGVNIIATSNSWGIPLFSGALYDAVETQRDAGILFIASAGNDGWDNDVAPLYPASYNLTNIISVAATNQTDELAVFPKWSSCYGPNSVHVAAPGVNINSTIPNNTYYYGSGTSMAAPHVSGLAALLKSENESMNMMELKNAILSNVDRIEHLEGKLITEGRINAYNALTAVPGEMHVRVQIQGGYSGSVGIGKDIFVSVSDGVRPITSAEVTVSFSSGEDDLTLLDDGQGTDQYLNDGYYSGKWIPQLPGQIVLNISVVSEEYGEYHREYNVTIHSYQTSMCLTSSVGNQIKNNTIQGYIEKGISLVEQSNENVIEGNYISGMTEFGIYMNDSHDNRLVNNTILENGLSGILLEHSGNNLITNNTVLQNVDCGILICCSSNDNNITNNNLSDNNWGGLYVYSSNGTTVTNNTISNNSYSIYLDLSNYNIIYHNNIINNTDQAFDNTGTNQWDAGDFAGDGKGGNYWSDYDGEDRGDGIGDTPYYIAGDAGAKDNYPWMEQDGWIG